ncbi:FxsA family protein [Botrimarina sp.]|uniref:FxsA family protein n=1 Tax=Botrimarina sp. TaxID=2795802 RepID=UPI0032F08ACC
MLLYLILLFTVLPIVEIALLFELGDAIGWLPTLAIALGTGVLGASLAKAQGLATLGKIRQQLSEGHPPGDALLDGALILVAGAVLITPGVLTDLFGFALLVPPVRAVAKRMLRRRFGRGSTRRSADGRTVVWSYDSGRLGADPSRPDRPVVEGDIIDAEVIDVHTAEAPREPKTD